MMPPPCWISTYQPQPLTVGEPSRSQPWSLPSGAMAWQVTTVTVPAEAATTVVPGGAAMSSPWWLGRCGVRNPDTIGPWTGWVQGPAAPQAASAACATPLTLDVGSASSWAILSVGGCP